MKFKDVDEIRNAVGPVAERMNIEIVEVEAKVGKDAHLTFYIDTEEGVDLDTCEKFHNAIDSVLDDFDPSYGASYTLNVSSPGVDRPFRTDRDFERHLGTDVEVRLYAPIRGKKFFEGVLESYDGNNVVIVTDGESVKLELNRIAKINESIKFD